MELVPPIELGPRSLAKYAEGEQSAGPSERLSKLCIWMMLLGSVRLICMLADYAIAFVEALKVEPFTMRLVTRVTDEIHPVVGLSALWPLVLAILLRRTRWPQLVPAAAATFLVLSIGGIIELSVQLGQARGYGGTVGSFHLDRRAFLHPTISDLALGTLGVSQLLLELMVAVRALLLVPAFRRGPDETQNALRQEQARRARHGRIAVYISLGFLFVVIRLPMWSTYLELLNNSTFVRNFVLENDQRSNWRRVNARRAPQLTEEEKRFNDYRLLINVSDQDARQGRHTEARDRYQEVIAAIDSMPDDSLPVEGRSLLALALNNLAWLQATCPRDRFSKPARGGQKRAPRHRDRARSNGITGIPWAQPSTGPAIGMMRAMLSFAPCGCKMRATASIGSSWRSSITSWANRPTLAIGTTRPSRSSGRRLRMILNSTGFRSRPLRN